MSKEIEAYVVDTNGSYELKRSIDEMDWPHSRKIVTSEEFLALANRTHEGFMAMQRALRKLYDHDPATEIVKKAYGL
jgi:Mlc titration factor MtfA (ptsG expression regulator)